MRVRIAIGMVAAVGVTALWTGTAGAQQPASHPVVTQAEYDRWQ